MFPIVRTLVLLCCDLETWRYSHDLHAKNQPAMESWDIAARVSVDWLSAIAARTQCGRAFCCFFLGSSFLSPRYCRCKRNPVSKSSSFVGFPCPFSLKVETRALMVFWIVVEARGLSDFDEYSRRRNAMAKAPMIRMRWSLDIEVRKRSCLSPILVQ